MRQGIPASIDPASLIDTLPTLLSIHEGSDHRYIFSNSAYDSVFGSRQPVGSPLCEVWPDLAAQVSDRFDRVLATGVVDTHSGFKVIVTNGNGQQQTRWYRQTLKPWRDGEDRLCGVISCAHEVTAEVEAEQALKNRAVELQFALDAAGGVGTWDWDVVQDRMAVDKPLAELFGQSHDNAKGLPLARFMDAILPEDRERVEAAIARAVEEGGEYRQDYRVKTADGDLRWVLARGRCFQDESGNPTHFPGVVFDTSRQVEERERLEQIDALLKSFVDNSASYVFAKDLDGRYIMANKFYLDAFGETEASLYGRTDRDRFGERESYSLNDRRVAENGAPIEFEEEARKADGEIIHAISVKFPLRDSRGVLFGTGSISTDVTDRKRAEAALRKSEARLRGLIEGIPQLVWRATDGGQFTWTSPQWQRITGLSDEHSRDRGWLSAIHPDDRGNVVNAWENAPSEGLLEVECRVRQAKGEGYRWFQWRAVPVRDQTGEVVEWLGTATDVDDLRRLQERQRVMVAELQHRTRNLLGVVRSISEETVLASQTLEDFRTAFNGRLAALSRVQGLLSRSDDEPITLGALLQTELDALGASGMLQRAKVEGPDVRLRRATVQTFALALHELATNARKHGALSTEHGRLDVSWHEHHGEGGRRLHLSWRETGLPLRSGAVSSGGYGRELIERALPYVLEARTSFELGEEELICTIDMPLPPEEEDRTTIE